MLQFAAAAATAAAAAANGLLAGLYFSLVLSPFILFVSSVSRCFRLAVLCLLLCLVSIIKERQIERQ